MRVIVEELKEGGFVVFKEGEKEFISTGMYSPPVFACSDLNTVCNYLKDRCFNAPEPGLKANPIKPPPYAPNIKSHNV